MAYILLHLSTTFSLECYLFLESQYNLLAMFEDVLPFGYQVHWYLRKDWKSKQHRQGEKPLGRPV